MREDIEDEVEDTEEFDAPPDEVLLEDGDIAEDEIGEDEIGDDEIGEDLEDAFDDGSVDLVDVVDDAVAPVAAKVVVVVEPDAPPGEDEDDDLDDDDDVEASLDVILKERLVVADDETEDDDDDVADAEDRADGNMRVLPKQPGEFVCQSCFLVKHQGQLADEKRMLCRDCV